MTANTLPDAAVAQQPTRVRYGVLWFACSLSMITYLDRVFMGSAASKFVEVLGLTSEADLKWVFGAFTLAYAMFEVPSGWLGDVFGPRNVLVRIVLWWSLFTAVTGLIGLHVGGFMLGGLGVLVLVRLLFGMGEAGAYPNITRALHNWFPLSERGFAQGAVWMSGRLMGGLTPVVWLLLVEGVNRVELFSLGDRPFVIHLPPLLGWLTPLAPWRGTFLLFGLTGVIWCVFFILRFRNRPEERSEVNAAELALIHVDRAESEAGHAHVPWRRILASRNVWFLCLMYFLQAYGWYFSITYLPRFMNLQYNVQPGSLLGAIYKGGPLWLGAVGCLVGGYLTDRYVRRTGDRRWGRRLIGMVGHGLSIVCFLACPFAPTAFTFFLAISLSGFCMDLTMGSSWAVCQDIGRHYAAIVAGFMNMVGNLGGFVANLVTGYILELALDVHARGLGLPVGQLSPEQVTAGLRPGYQIVFLSFAVAFVLGVICWSQIDASQPVVPDEEDVA